MNITSRRTVAATAIAVGIAQDAVWIALCAVLIAVVPGFERIFKEFDAPLPNITKLVILLTHMLFHCWFLALPMILAWPLVSWGVVSLLSPRPEFAAPRQLWYVLTWLAPILFAGYSIVALFVPLCSGPTPLSR